MNFTNREIISKPVKIIGKVIENRQKYYYKGLNYDYIAHLDEEKENTATKINAAINL